MRKARRPQQNFFQINIRGTEDTLPDARQLAAFLEAYHRLYVILRIGTDPSYNADSLVNRGYRVRQRDRLRVRSFRMSSPFDANFLLLAVPEAVLALKWLVPMSVDVFKTIRENPKIQAEIAKLRAEEHKTLAEARKIDAETRKTDAETQRILQELAPAEIEEQTRVPTRTVAPSAELSLDRTKEVSEEINKNLLLENLPGNLEEIVSEFLPPQARLPLSRALTDMIKSRFVITHVEVVAVRIADDSDETQPEE